MSRAGGGVSNPGVGLLSTIGAKSMDCQRASLRWQDFVRIAQISLKRPGHTIDYVVIRKTADEFMQDCVDPVRYFMAQGLADTLL